MVSAHNLVMHRPLVDRRCREKMNGHRSVVLWFTGLSGSGKSTLANAVSAYLHQHKVQTTVLDGDNVRFGLNSDLGFTHADRTENIRRVGEVAKLFLEAGMIVLTAFISPFHDDRVRARKLFDKADFLEIYCRCPLEVCEERDVKGSYKRARNGEIGNFTGIGSAYETPVSPDLIVDTDLTSLEESVASVLALLRQNGVIDAPPAIQLVP